MQMRLALINAELAQTASRVLKGLRFTGDKEKSLWSVQHHAGLIQKKTKHMPMYGGVGIEEKKPSQNTMILSPVLTKLRFTE